MTQLRNVWLAGATGLVGRETRELLLTDPAIEHVLTPVRRATGVMQAKLEERIVDFERLESALAGGRADVAICCLGTTIKQAGSQAAFRKVDHDYVLAFARAALAASARHFIVVTALGSDPHSRVFYNRVKGEVEAALSAMPFAALSIARPSLLLGERSEFRLGERVFAPFSKLLPAKIRGIEARTVANALLALAKSDARGKRIVPSEELQKLGSLRS